MKILMNDLTCIAVIVFGIIDLSIIVYNNIRGNNKEYTWD